MSYAGPASRTKRAPDITPNSTGIARPAGASARASATSQHSEERSSGTAFAAGIVLGIAIGAGVALLVAPESGRNTRRALVRRGRIVGRRGRDAWDDLRDEFRHAIRDKRRAWRLKRERAADAAGSE